MVNLHKLFGKKLVDNANIDIFFFLSFVFRHTGHTNFDAANFVTEIEYKKILNYLH